MADSILNRQLIRDYVCAQCESGLIEICDVDDDWRVVCSKDKGHVGRIRMSTVAIRKAQSAHEGVEIRIAFPDLVEQRSVIDDLAELGF